MSVKRVLAAAGWADDFTSMVPTIPISALVGDNVNEPSQNMPWWTGWSVATPAGAVCLHTLVQAFERTVMLYWGDPTAHLRFCVSCLYAIRGIGRVVTGVVEQGTLRMGMEVVFHPNHRAELPCVGTVSSIDRFKEHLSAAGPGASVGVLLKGLDKNNLPRAGSVMMARDEANEPPRAVLVAAHLFDECVTGSVVRLQVAAASVEASVWHVERMGDSNAVVLELASDSRLFCEPFAESPTFGIAYLWRMNSADELIALGGITRVERWGDRARRARSAVLAVLLAFRGILSRDVARMVALIVWDSRCDRA
jgi:translation elongation factor EF-1alpha